MTCASPSREWPNAREIQDIVQIILDIAGQTNLLSMNAPLSRPPTPASPARASPS